MRIAWVVYGSLDQWTGGYVYDRLVVRALRDRGHAVTVLSLRAGRAGEAVRLSVRLADDEHDVVVADELCHREVAFAFAALALRQLRRAGPHRVLLVHHLAEWEDERPRLSEWTSLRLAERVITTSGTSSERIQRTLGIAAASCLPGSDRLQFLPRAPRAGDRVELLFVGTFTRRKGLVELLEALLPLSDSNYRLTVVGDATRDVATTARVHLTLARDPRLSERIRLLGTVDDARLSELYSESDVLVAPSHFEGYGMALGEALRAGLPVVATRVGAIPEAVGDGEHAWLLPARDRNALTSALRRIILEPELRERMQGATTRLDFVTWAETGERFEHCLAALVQDAGSKARAARSSAHVASIRSAGSGARGGEHRTQTRASR